MEDKREYKEEDGMTVDKESSQRFLMACSVPHQHHTAMKCSGCQMLTSHSMLSISMYDYDGKVDSITKRIMGCQNCGKITTK